MTRHTCKWTEGSSGPTRDGLGLGEYAGQDGAGGEVCTSAAPQQEHTLSARDCMPAAVHTPALTSKSLRPGPTVSA